MMYVLDEGLYWITTGLWNQFARGIKCSRGDRDVESGGYLYCRNVLFERRLHAFANRSAVYQPADYRKREQKRLQVAIKAHDRMLAPALNGHMPVDLHTHPAGKTLGFSPSDRNVNRSTRRFLQSLSPGTPLGIGVVDHSLDPAQTHLLCLHKYGHVRPMALALVDSGEMDAFDLWQREGAALWQRTTVYRPDPERVGLYQFEPTFREMAIDFPLDLWRTSTGVRGRFAQLLAAVR
jgi:hypothetical protein